MRDAILVTVFLCITLSGCRSNQPEVIPTPLVSKNASMAPTQSQPIPKTTIIPTRTVTLPESTLTATFQKCPIINPQRPLEELVHEGTVYYTGQLDRYPSYLQDLETGKRHALPAYWDSQSVALGPSISPNQNLLFFLDNGPNQGDLLYWVIKADGSVVRSIPFTHGWGYAQWINDQSIGFVAGNIDQEGEEVLINVQTGQQHKIEANFGPLINLEKYALLRSAWLFKYNAERNRVIYLSDPIGVILWDVSQEKVLWQRDADLYVTAMNNVPDWSPSGKQVAVLIDGVLSLVDLDGKETQFSNTREPTLPFVRGFIWSPDGSAIALWASEIVNSGISQLMILNVYTKQIEEFCVKTEEIGNPIVWSPDSRYLIVTSAIDETSNWKTLLIDRSEQSIVQIPVSPYGWMNSIH